MISGEVKNRNEPQKSGEGRNERAERADAAEAAE